MEGAKASRARANIGPTPGIVCSLRAISVSAASFLVLAVFSEIRVDMVILPESKGLRR